MSPCDHTNENTNAGPGVLHLLIKPSAQFRFVQICRTTPGPVAPAKQDSVVNRPFNCGLLSSYDGSDRSVRTGRDCGDGASADGERIA
jgi:hypothetical protein